MLQIARTVRPAAIFVDILMPGLNGWDVLATLKSDPVTARIPVIMLSVMEDRQKALDLGADAVMAKPLESSKVRQIMSAALAAQKNSLPKRAAG